MLRMILLNTVIWGAAVFAATGLARAPAPPRIAWPAPDAAALGAAARTLPSLALPGPEAFAAIAERPLFSPSRRPRAAAQASPAAAEGPPPLALIGVAGDAASRVALATVASDAGSAGGSDAGSDGGGETLRLKVGDGVGAWRVEAIDPRSITLSRGAERRRVALGEGAPAAGASRGPARARAAHGLIAPDQPGLDSDQQLDFYDN